MENKKQYLAMSVISKEAKIKPEKVKFFLNNHKQFIDCIEGTKYPKTNKTEIEKLQYIEQLHKLGLTTFEVSEVLEDANNINKYRKFASDYDYQNGMTRKQLINAFYDNAFPPLSCFKCKLTGRTAVFLTDKIVNKIGDYTLTMHRTVEQWTFQGLFNEL
ncbi:hypothetical protein [Lentibacillus jeotgali]|uniref:hypothetical protein n=1 Tax=Lentibacillus jeotgali TaxID=558169 RepID=UPI0002625C74|nr:hypothetical protein [Lentibacillus jeotgali]